MLGLASTLAATGKAAEAQASRKGLQLAVGSLAEQMLAVEEDLRLFASEDSISTEIFDSPGSSLAKEAGAWTVSEGHSSSPSLPMEGHQHTFVTPGAGPYRNEMSASSCSSISFIKGDPANQASPCTTASLSRTIQLSIIGQRHRWSEHARNTSRQPSLTPSFLHVLVAKGVLSAFLSMIARVLLSDLARSISSAQVAARDGN